MQEKEEKKKKVLFEEIRLCYIIPCTFLNI